PSDIPGERAGQRKGLETFLCAHNLSYFFVDGHHVLKEEKRRGGYGQDAARELSMRKRSAPPGGYGERFLPPEVRGKGVADETGAGEIGAEERKALYAVHRT